MVKTKLLEITEDGVKVEGPEGEREIPCDHVIIAVGYKAEQSLKDALTNKPYKVFGIGDYNGGGQIMKAVEEGFQLIRHLDDSMEVEQAEE